MLSSTRGTWKIPTLRQPSLGDWQRTSWVLVSNMFTKPWLPYQHETNVLGAIGGEGAERKRSIARGSSHDFKKRSNRTIALATSTFVFADLQPRPIFFYSSCTQMRSGQSSSLTFPGVLHAYASRVTQHPSGRRFEPRPLRQDDPPIQDNVARR